MAVFIISIIIMLDLPLLINLGTSGKENNLSQQSKPNSNLYFISKEVIQVLFSIKQEATNRS